MSGPDANAWCRRHERELEVKHRQGKVHLVVWAVPRGALPITESLSVPEYAPYRCTACAWVGNDPEWVETGDHFQPPLGSVPLCPRCEGFTLTTNEDAP
jgi:hypothetical protein